MIWLFNKLKFSVAFIKLNISKSKIQSSGVCYTDNIKHTIANLEDNQTYYIRATCITLNGMEADTGYIEFSVNYKQPSIYSLIDLTSIFMPRLFLILPYFI